MIQNSFSKVKTEKLPIKYFCKTGRRRKFKGAIKIDRILDRELHQNNIEGICSNLLFMLMIGLI